jgi:ribonucleoside-diphosphate reductase alpha chain
MLKIVNNTVPGALKRLGYDDSQVKAIVEFVNEHDTIEGAPHLRDEDLPVFDCAFKAAKGKRFIHHMGHVKMMAAVQPFVSGAISKTVNMPRESTVEDIAETYLQAWKLGLKAIAIYRDGSKRTQPLNTSLKAEKGAAPVTVVGKPYRRRLPDTREAVTHKFSVGGHEGYLTVGLYEDHMPGEIFIVMAKEGAVISGLIDTVATLTSIALQYGVPLEMLTTKFKNTRFEPSGVTTNPDIPMASSIVDYVFKWLEKRFIPPVEEGKVVEHPKSVEQRLEKFEKLGFQPQSDAPPCTECGGIMVRKGPCYFCMNCLHQTGGCS